MNNYTPVIPTLEDRFLPPSEWRSDTFTNPNTAHKIYYNFALPTAPKAIILMLPGLSEFGEKYAELARECLEKNYGFYVIDWAYQGRSTRHTQNPHKRHSDGYDADLSDLDYFIKNIIKTEAPLMMLAHSMGGNIGLRYLSEYSNTIKAAGFSAPMLGIQDLRYTGALLEPLLKIVPCFHEYYIPNGKNWSETARPHGGEGVFSSDPKRRKIHNAFCLSDPALQVGNVTIKWVYESLKSIRILKKKIPSIETPLLVALAGQEKLVDNAAIEKTMATVENVTLLQLPHAKHEILVECDESRNTFLEAFFELVETQIRANQSSSEST